MIEPLQSLKHITAVQTINLLPSTKLLLAIFLHILANVVVLVWVLLGFFSPPLVAKVSEVRERSEPLWGKTAFHTAVSEVPKVLKTSQ